VGLVFEAKSNRQSLSNLKIGFFAQGGRTMLNLILTGAMWCAVSVVVLTLMDEAIKKVFDLLGR